MVIKIEEDGKIYYKHFDKYDKYLAFIKSNEKSLS